MPLIQINEKNKKEYGGKCVVLQSHINAGVNVQPGDIVEKFGMDYFEGKQCKMIRDYDPAIDDPPVEITNDQSSMLNEEIPNIEREQLPDLEKAVKKLGPKRKKKTN